MLTEADVAELRAALQASQAASTKQAEELFHQSQRIRELECRTPRPEWSAVLHGRCASALGLPEASAHQRDGSGMSSAELAAALSDKLSTYASQLQVSSALTC